MTFSPTSPPLARALAERNYDRPTPVQTAVLADEAAGRDLLVSAQTGSGKTVAYGLAIAKDLLGQRRAVRAGRRAACPDRRADARTRLQVHRELAWLYQYADARVVSCVGGMDPRREQRELAAGAHIVVGTPGRLCDHLRRGRLDVSELKAVVLDEADEMLDLGFREDMEFILETTPETRRTLLFSATLPRGIVALAKEYQQQAFRVEVAGDEGGHADIEYRAIRIAAGDVEHAVVNVLRFFESPSALVFCNTRDAVRHLQATLLERGFSVVALSGELTQNERTQALQALRDGRARVCVATDVAARGIDLPNLDLVIHADIPNDAEVMQHRSGRTGRAGRKGVSVLLVPPARTAPRGNAAQSGRHRRRLGDGAPAGRNPQARSGAHAAGRAVRGGDDRRRSGAGAGLAGRAVARGYRRGTGAALSRAAAVARGYHRSRRGAWPVSRRARPGAGRPHAARRDRDDGPRSKAGKSSPRDGMAEGSVWFRAAIGRRKNAEARWLLPMICRRGGIDKHDIGAIRIMDTTTEFEISARVAESFAVKIKRPDKEDNIRIEALADAPQGAAVPERQSHTPRRAAHDEAAEFVRNALSGHSHDERAPKPHDKFHGDKSHAGKPHAANLAPTSPVTRTCRAPASPNTSRPGSGIRTSPPSPEIPGVNEALPGNLRLERNSRRNFGAN